MFLTNDGKFLFLRNDNKKGVKILSLEDGSRVGEIKNIHKGPIKQIIVSKDNRYVITTANDKKVKVYDWVNEVPF